MHRTEALQGVRVIKFRSVFDRYEASELSQIDAADLLGVSERTFRRWCVRFEEAGEAGLQDRCLGHRSSKRVPSEREQQIETLYRNCYNGFTAKHLHEHLVRDHGFTWGYTWTKLFLQSKGLLVRASTRGVHRRKRPRRPLPGMMLHQDGSRHAWLAELDAMDLIVTMDDATNVIYSAFLLPEEGTASTFRALLEVFGTHGLPLSLYTDRAATISTRPRPMAKSIARIRRRLASTGAAGRGAHRGLFARGARAVGASVSHLAGPAGEGTGAGWDQHRRICQRIRP